MTQWKTEQLERIGKAEEVQIASKRHDGTLRKPVTVWAVRHGDDLYVRPVAGRQGRWFRGVQETYEGDVRAGGVHQEVTFLEPDDKVNDEIDAAYRTKYRRYAGKILNSVLTPEARSGTLKLVPRPHTS